MSSIPSSHELIHIIREDKNAAPPRVVSPLVPPRRRGERRSDEGNSDPEAHGHLMNSSSPLFILPNTEVTEGISANETTTANENADKNATVLDRKQGVEGGEGNDVTTAESSGLFTPTTCSANASKDHSPMRSSKRRERRREGGGNSPRPSSTSTSVSSSPSKGSHAQNSRRSFQEVLYQHQSHRAPLDPVAEKWMTILGTGTIVRSTLGEASMAMIPMLGTHDSATYGIHESSDFAADAPKILDQIPRYLMGYTKKLVSHWARCQSVSMLEQLFRGVRYFDVRLCPRKKDSKVAKRHPKDICHTRIHPPPEIAERTADHGLAELFKISHTPFEKPVTVADKAKENLEKYVFPPSSAGARRASAAALPLHSLVASSTDEEGERSKGTRRGTKNEKNDDRILGRTDSCSSSTFGRSSDSNFGSGTFSNFVGSPTADERTAMLRQFTGAKDPTRSLHLHSGDGNAALELPESSFSSSPRPPPSLFSSPNSSRSQKGSEGACPITSTSYAEAMREIIASGKAPGLASPNTSRPLFGDLGLSREESKLLDGEEEEVEVEKGAFAAAHTDGRGSASSPAATSTSKPHEQSSQPSGKAPTAAPQPANPYEDELWVTHSSLSLPLQVIVQELCIFYSSILEPVREGRYRGDGYGTSMAYRREKRAKAAARRKKDQKRYNHLNTSSSTPQTHQSEEMPARTINDNGADGGTGSTSAAAHHDSPAARVNDDNKSPSLKRNSRASSSSSSLGSVIIHKRTETAVGCFGSFAADTLNGCVEGEDEQSPYEKLFPPAATFSQSEAGAHAQEPPQRQPVVCANETTADKLEKYDKNGDEERPVAGTPLHGRRGTALPLALSNNSSDHSHVPSPNNRLSPSNLNGETPPPRSSRQTRLSEVEADHIINNTKKGKLAEKRTIDSPQPLCPPQARGGESLPTPFAKSISANASEVDGAYATDDEVGSTDLDLGQEALNYCGEEEANTDTDDYDDEDGDGEEDAADDDENINGNMKKNRDRRGRGPRDHDFLATNLEVIVLDFQRCTNFTPQHVKTFLDIMSPLMPLFVRKPKSMSTPLKELWQTPERIFVFFPTNTMAIGRDILSIPYLSPEDFRRIVAEGGVEEGKKGLKNKEGNEGGTDKQQQQQRLDQAVVAADTNVNVMGTEDAREMQKSGDLCSSRTGAVAAEEEKEREKSPDPQSSSYGLSSDPCTCTCNHMAGTKNNNLQRSPTTQYIVDATGESVDSASSSSSIAPPPSSAASAVSGISSVPSHLRGTRAGRTPMDFLYRRDDTVIVSKWFNRRVDLPLFRDAQQELYERSLVPIHHRTQLHVLQGVLTPTTQDLVQSILQRNPKAKSILEYACDVNSVLLGIWESHGDAHRHITFPLEAADDGRGKGRSKLGTIGSAFLFGGFGIGGGGEHEGTVEGRGHSRSASTQSSAVVDPLLPGRSVAVDGRNILMLDFFQVGRSPLGFDAFTTACWRPCLDRFTNAYAPSPTPALSIGAFPLRFSAPSLPQTPLIAQQKLALSLAVMGVAGGGNTIVGCGRSGSESRPPHVKSFSNASNQSMSGSITVRSTTILGRLSQGDSSGGGGGNSIATLSPSPSRYTNGTSDSPSSTLSRTVAGLPLYSTPNEDNGEASSHPQDTNSLKDEANIRGGVGLGSATLQVLSRVVGSIATGAGVQRASLGGGNVISDRDRSPPYATTVHDLAIAAANKAVDAVVTQPATYMRVQLDNLLEGRPIHLDPIGGRAGEVSPQDPLGQGGPSYAGASGDGVSEYADDSLTVGPPPASLSHVRSRIGGGGGSRSRSHSSKSTLLTPSGGRAEDGMLTREREHGEQREKEDDTSFLLREKGLAKAVLKSADVLLMKRKDPLGDSTVAATTSSSSFAPDDDDGDTSRGEEDEDEDEAEAIAREKRRLAEASGSYIANANYGRRLSEDDGEGGRRISSPFLVDPLASSVSLGGAAGIATSSSPKKGDRGHLSRSSAAVVSGGGHAASSGSFLRFPSLSMSSLTRRRGGKDHHNAKAEGPRARGEKREDSSATSSGGRNRSAFMSSSTSTAVFSYRRYVGTTIVKSGSYLWSWAVWPAKLVAASSSYCLDTYRKAKPRTNANAGEGDGNDNKNVNESTNAAQFNGSARALKEEEDDSPLASYAQERDLQKNGEIRRLTTAREGVAT